jgi:hypothetical protein
MEKGKKNEKHIPLTMDSLISSNNRASSVFSCGQKMLHEENQF